MRTLKALFLSAIVLLLAASDGGGAMDPNGRPKTTTSACSGDYTACVDPNGRPPR